MPTYNYQCKNKHREEHEHSIFDDPQIMCGVCQQIMGRVPAGITPRFIGKDFYSNDKNA